MGTIINKSNHPVTIKRIKLKIWALRDEIEAAVSLKLKNAKETGTEPDITDLQTFYGRGPNRHTNTENDSPLQDQNMDTAGNPMDEDAAEMLAALQGDGEESEESSTEESSTEENSDEASEENIEATNDDSKASAEAVDDDDDEAAAMAMAMLADQGITPEGEESQDGEKDLTQDTSAFERVRPKKEKISDGFCLLSDLNMDYLLFFSKHNYLQGQTVVLEFQIPKKFILTCEILKSDDIVRTSKIISQTKPGFRVQSILTFNQPGERSTLREFLQSIEPEIPPPPSKLKKPQGDDDDDDDSDEFEDLGF